MNIEDIKKRLAYFPRERQDGGFSDNSLAFGARLDIEYLLSVIEQAEKALEEVYECGSIKQAEIIAKQALKSIQGDE